MIPASGGRRSPPAIAVYSAAMESSRPTLPQRVTAVLHAKQYLVFFAIGL